MQRLRRAAFPLALVAALALAVVILVEESAAELENLVFTSRTDRLRMIVPRGWRASDQPSYPGLLLWMARSQPQGQLELTAETFTRDLYCSWPVTCRTSHEGLPSKYACALRLKLQAQRLHVGPDQAGPKDNEAAGLSSIWFEYDDGRHFLRQAIAFSSDRAISLVLSAPTSEARATHSRAFEQALRTLHLLSPEETARVAGIDAAVLAPPDDAVPADSSALADGAVLDAGVMFESAPAPKIDLIGPVPVGDALNEPSLLRQHERAAEARRHLLGRDLAVAVGVERGEHRGRAAPLLARDEAVAVEVEHLEEVVRGVAGLRLGRASRA